MLGTVREQPGVHAGRVARLVPLPVSTARYHLERLVRAGRLEADSFGQYRSFYPPAVQDDDERLVLHHLNRGVVGWILRYIVGHGPSQQGDLVVGLGRSVSTISHHLRNLQDTGLVTARKGSPLEYHLAHGETVHTVLRRYPRLWVPCCDHHPQPPVRRDAS